MKRQIGRGRVLSLALANDVSHEISVKVILYHHVAPEFVDFISVSCMFVNCLVCAWVKCATKLFKAYFASSGLNCK